MKTGCRLPMFKIFFLHLKCNYFLSTFIFFLLSLFFKQFVKEFGPKNEAVMTGVKILFDFFIFSKLPSWKLQRNGMSVWLKDGDRHSQWIHLHLPFCRPRFESQAHHLSYYIVKFCATFVIAFRKWTKIKVKEAVFGP